MAITNGYATLAEFKAWVQLDDTYDDAELESVVEASSRWIDQYCQRHFWQATGPRVFDACDNLLLRLGAFNDLVAVTAVATDENADGTYETSWSATDYQLLPLRPLAAPEQRPYREIRSTGTRLFPLPWGTSRQGLVQITGTWGWPAVPDSVHQACLIQASSVFKRRQSPEGVAGFGEFGAIRISGRPDPTVDSLLAPYRQKAVFVA